MGGRTKEGEGRLQPVGFSSPLSIWGRERYEHFCCPLSGVPPLDRQSAFRAGTVATLHALVDEDDGAIEWIEASMEDRSWTDSCL